MKKFLITFLITIIAARSFSQSVLIGNGLLNLRAMLEVRSNSKGVLIPRMTTTQRNNIPSPQAGLMVYDTSRDELYAYDGTTWRYLLDNGFWKLSSNNNVYNLSDSIGIGITSPDEKLHVNGDIKTTEGDIFFSESSGTASKLISDYNGVNVDGYNHSIGFYDGNTRTAYLQYRKFDASDEHRLEFGFGFGANNFSIQTNGVSYLTADGATLQLQTAGVDKGFVQLSGSDLRLGTNSTNNTGRFIIRSGATDRFFVDASGRVGVGSPAPAGKILYVDGALKGSSNLQAINITPVDVRITTEVNSPSKTGTANMVPLYYGAVAANGTCNCSAASVTVTNPFPGNYTISYPGMNGNDIVIITPNYVDVRASATYGGLGAQHPGFAVFIRSNSYSGPSTFNADFSFIVFKQ